MEVTDIVLGLTTASIPVLVTAMIKLWGDVQLLKADNERNQLIWKKLDELGKQMAHIEIQLTRIIVREEQRNQK
jgi:hypothetical protein